MERWSSKRGWNPGSKESGEKAISEYKAIFDYAESIRLPVDFVQLAWASFPAPLRRVDCQEKEIRLASPIFAKPSKGTGITLFHDV